MKQTNNVMQNAGTIIGFENLNNLTAIIYLKDIKRLRLLSYSSTNSIKKFLRENNIPVLGNNRKHILAFQLHRAFLQLRIRELRGVYGAGWAQVLQSEMNLYTQHRKALEEIIPDKVAMTDKDRKPHHSGNAVEAKFLLDVEKITR
jgi:hypothetical protein